MKNTIELSNSHGKVLIDKDFISCIQEVNYDIWPDVKVNIRLKNDRVYLEAYESYDEIIKKLNE